MSFNSSDTLEKLRLTELRRYDVLDTPGEPTYDDVATLASQICQTPVALITLMDTDRQWFKAKVGTDLTQTPRNISFCEHAIRQPNSLMQVPDATLDPRFADNPFVTGAPGIRFYAGMPLTTPGGHALGTICVVDLVPRQLDEQQQAAMKSLARQVVSLLELRRNAAENARLLADTAKAARRAYYSAMHDSMTGLPNRTRFTDRLAACVKRSAREPDYRYCVMFIDMDRLKLVNDSLGHAAGDMLITTVARRLNDVLNSIPEVTTNYMLARFGGDAFMLLLDDLSDVGVVDEVVRHVRAMITKPFHYGREVIHPDAGLGIVIGHSGYVEADALLRDAEAALYHAKAAGRGKVARFTPKMHEQAVNRLHLESELRCAIERNELLLHYQPVVSLDRRQVIGFEALVRWNHDGRIISPAEFIPIAEETGLIVPIGRWVIAEAVRQAARWRDGHPHLPAFKMAVNVSRRQLADNGLVAHVQRLLDETRLPPQSLMIEITESVVMGDAADARRVLNRLRDLGVMLAMDDFGTGHSSLSCLHQFDLDVLKIDRSFVSHFENGRQSAVLRSVVNLAHALGMTVVAEGIETAEQMAFLQASHCDYGQGYLFARPLQASDAEAFLTRSTLARCA
ncbi:MAG TPA: GGDEF domain-containing protein [Tepidisphaeraceae bacterium]|jgi:diguanylate cyclase (GGDEF)-like protein